VKIPIALIFAHARRSWLRSLLTLGSVFIAIFVFGAMRTVVNSIEAAVSGTSAQRMVTESAVSLFVNLPRKIGQQMKTVPGVKEVADLTWFGGTYVHPDNFFGRFGVEPEAFKTVYTSDVEMSAEEWKNFKENRTACIIGPNLQARYKFKIGDPIPLKGSIFPGTYELKVAGIYKPKTTSFDPTTLYFHWDYLNEVSKKNDGPREVVSIFSLLLDAPQLGPDVARAVDEHHANSANRTRTVTERAFTAGFMSMWGNLPFFFNFLSAVALVATLMVTLNTMLLNARERVKEVGILKTLGFGDKVVLALFLSESLALCLIGGLLGTAAFRAMDGQVIPKLEQPLFVSDQTVMIAIGLSVVLGVLSGIAPSMGAARLKITEALRRHD
jgi:putative ABC transport system permease protein